MIRSAAAADPDMRELWARIGREFHANQLAVVRSLEAARGLRPGFDVATATDILWTLDHPDVWLLLAGEQGWSPDAFERWFGDTVCAQLLAPR